MSKRQIGIYGAGGFAREVAWLIASSESARSHECVAYIDDSVDRAELLNDCPVMAFDEFRNAYPDALITIGVGDPGVRRRIAEKCVADKIEFATLRHHSAEMSDYVSCGAGSIVSAGSILTVNISIGAHVHINLDCTIGHDVCIGDFATLSPGVHVSGNVDIGEDVYIGTGANIINGSQGKPLVVGSGSVIGAGSCVTSSLEPGGLYVGVPAKLKRKLE